VKPYEVQHSIDEYTFPKEAHIHNVMFDEKHMHVELTDQRMITYTQTTDGRTRSEIEEEMKIDPTKLVGFVV
jgi:hypothetical protein